VKPRSFDYVRPKSLPEALALLQRHGPDAKIIAGGQSLVPILNMRLASPSILVDIGAGKLAESNAAQVMKARQIIEGLGLEIATPDEARKILQLKGGDKVGF
jgi:hypothetical protein